MAGSNLLKFGPVSSRRKRWLKWVRWIILILVVGEIAFLLRMRVNYSLISGLPSVKSRNEDDNKESSASADFFVEPAIPRPDSRCETWLEEHDFLGHGRNFSQAPISVAFFDNQIWDKCSVGCIFTAGIGTNVQPDGVKRPLNGANGIAEQQAAHILQSMESASYYPENDIDSARRRGYDVVMTTSLTSDVPVGYFSWAEYDIMSPVQKKTENALAAAFISNCGGHNFRLEALEDLTNHGVTVDSYGQCLRTRNGRGVNKLEALRQYKFSLAFENSNEDDYVTEKFWQSLVAGAVPVVVGAPNIANFAPAPNAVLHIRDLEDLPRVAREMKYLASNCTAYNESLQWKYHGPSDQFKALVDMAAVHSSCRLCIHLATNIRKKEEQQLAASLRKPRPCKCADSSGVITYHLFVRERGRYEQHSVFLKSTELTAVGLRSAVLAKFKAMNHVPIWWDERPEMIRGDGTLKLHTLYPIGLHQREALYSAHFQTAADVRAYIEFNPCPQLEVIFV